MKIRINHENQHVFAQGNHLILVSRTFGIHTRIGNLAWTYPAFVSVEKDGVVRKLPIMDVTRIITWFLWSLSLVFLAHSSVGRVFGYGLKYLVSPNHTHLGMIGRQAKT